MQKLDLFITFNLFENNNDYSHEILSIVISRIGKFALILSKKESRKSLWELLLFSSREVKLLDLTNLNNIILKEISGEKFFLSPNENVALIIHKGNIKLLNLINMAETILPMLPKTRVENLLITEIDNSSKLIFASFLNRESVLYNIADFKNIRAKKITDFTDPYNEIVSAAFSEDKKFAKQFITIVYSKSTKILDVTYFDAIKIIEVIKHDDPILKISANKTNTLVVSVLTDGQIKLTDLRNLNDIKEIMLDKVKDDITNVSFSNDDRFILIQYQAKEPELFKIDDLNEITSIRLNQNHRKIKALDFVLDDQFMITIHEDNSAILYDLQRLTGKKYIFDKIFGGSKIGISNKFIMFSDYSNKIQFVKLTDLILNLDRLFLIGSLKDLSGKSIDCNFIFEDVFFRDIFSKFNLEQQRYLIEKFNLKFL